MSIQCSNCNATEFYLQNGRSFCRKCKVESEEHGHETLVDEETIGAFDTSVVSTLKRT